jgi:hypothetical protein
MLRRLCGGCLSIFSRGAGQPRVHGLPPRRCAAVPWRPDALPDHEPRRLARRGRAEPVPLAPCRIQELCRDAVGRRWAARHVSARCLRFGGRGHERDSYPLTLSECVFGRLASLKPIGYIGMHNRTFDPYLTALYRILISVMQYVTQAAAAAPGSQQVSPN